MGLKAAAVAAVMVLIISGSGAVYCMSDHSDGLTPIELFDVLDELRNTQDFAVKLYQDQLLYEGYDVFPGTADGTLGLIFTDYSRIYTDEGGRTVVSCGFTPMGGRPPEKGIEAVPVEDDGLAYVVETTHRSMSYQGIYNLSYFKAEIKNGVFGYTEVPLHSAYSTKGYDEEAKAIARERLYGVCLYDYDRDVYLIGNGGRLEPYLEDYSSLVDGFMEFFEDGVRIRYTQETYVEESREYVLAYLDSVRYAKGDFCGYPIDAIQEAIRNLGAHEVLLIDGQGLRIDLSSEAKVARSVLSIGCFVLGVACSFIPGGPIMGAVISATVDTVIGLAMTGEVPDPASLMVSAISGAACGALRFASAAKNITLGAVVNGATAVAYDVVSGASFRETVADGLGEAAAGALIGVLFKTPNHHPVKERSVDSLGKASAVSKGKGGESSKLTSAGKDGGQPSVDAMAAKATKTFENNRSNLGDAQKASVKDRPVRDILAHYGVQPNMVSGKLHADGKGGMTLGKDVNIPSTKKDGSSTTFESDGQNTVARTVRSDGTVEIEVAGGGKTMHIRETGPVKDDLGVPEATYGKNTSEAEGIEKVTAVIKSGSGKERVAVVHFDPAKKNVMSVKVFRGSQMVHSGPEM